MTKRALPREPLSDEEIDAGGLYYSDEDIDQIIDALPNPTIIDRDRFRNRLERFADRYVGIAHGRAKYDQAPSIQVKRWAALGGALDVSLDKLSDLPPAAVANLDYAAERVAERSGKLPDFERDEIELDALPGVPESEGQTVPTWAFAAGKQIAKCKELFRWLREVIAEAEDEAEKDRSEVGGNRPDDSKYEFCRGLKRICYDFRQHEMSAWTDRMSSSDESDEIVGPLADFLEACFRPLGVKDSRAALVRTYLRATKPRRATRT